MASSTTGGCSRGVRLADPPVARRLCPGEWGWFLSALRDLGVALGLLVTGGQLSVAEFLDPGALLQTGIKSAAVIWTAFQAHTGLTQVFTALPLLLAWAAYCAAFAVMAYKVFWWQVELLIAGVAGICLLPCLVLRQTSFVATGVLSYAANAFARFLLGAIAGRGALAAPGRV